MITTPLRTVQIDFDCCTEFINKDLLSVRITSVMQKLNMILKVETKTRLTFAVLFRIGISTAWKQTLLLHQTTCTDVISITSAACVPDLCFKSVSKAL